MVVDWSAQNGRSFLWAFNKITSNSFWEPKQKCPPEYYQSVCKCTIAETAMVTSLKRPDIWWRYDDDAPRYRAPFSAHATSRKGTETSRRIRRHSLPTAPIYWLARAVTIFISWHVLAMHRCHRNHLHRNQQISTANHFRFSFPNSGCSAP